MLKVLIEFGMIQVYLRLAYVQLFVGISQLFTYISFVAYPADLRIPSQHLHVIKPYRALKMEFNLTRYVFCAISTHF